MSELLEHYQRLFNLYPRAYKLMNKHEEFLVIAKHEPYYNLVYALIREQEKKQKKWTEDDERIYQEETLAGTGCHWKLDEPEYNTWKGDCGKVWFFEDGDPEENQMLFCPGCGRPVIQE